MRTTPLWISDVEVAAVLTQEMALSAVERGLTAHAKNQVDQPLKVYVRPCGREKEFEFGRHIAMPGCIRDGDNVVGIKWISSVPKNIERGLPRASGILVLNDFETGHPLAVIECGVLSARRTGAVAAVCWKHLGMPGDIVAIIGCGPVNKEVVLALSSLKKQIKQFRVFDLNRERATEFWRSLARQLDYEIRVSPSLEACLNRATTIITATTGPKGYINPQWVKDAKLLIPLSLDDFQAETLLSANKIIVDDFDQCNREEKLFHHVVRDELLTRERIYAELGEIVTGMKPGRLADEIIYCNLMGMAVEDISVARAIYGKIISKENQ